MKKKCPVCKENYTRKNPQTKHHQLPQRHYHGKGKIFLLCKRCHQKLERFITAQEKLTEERYYEIMKDFVLYNNLKGYK